MKSKSNLRCTMPARVLNLSSKCFHLLPVFFTIFIASCNGGVADDLPNSEKVNVQLKVSSIEQIPFDNAMRLNTKAGTGDVTALCSSLSYALYQNGERVVSESQKIGDETFGSFNLSLSEGDYQVVVVGHNGDANPTVATKVEKEEIKIQFSGNKETTKMTDTFNYYGTLSVGAQSTSLNVDLKRSVAMFCLVMEDDIPENVKSFEIECEGGSSTLGAISGKGVVKSTQTETYMADVNNKQLSLYTFPRADSDKLSVTISAKDIDGHVLKQLKLDEVPITLNRISKYTGPFFKGGCAVYHDLSFPLSINGDWGGTDEYSYNQ